MAVWRLSKELDFFKPRVGPSSTGVDGAEGTERETDIRQRQITGERSVILSLLSLDGQQGTWFGFGSSVETI